MAPHHRLNFLTSWIQRYRHLREVRRILRARARVEWFCELIASSQSTARKSTTQRPLARFRQSLVRLLVDAPAKMACQLDAAFPRSRPGTRLWLRLWRLRQRLTLFLARQLILLLFASLLNRLLTGSTSSRLGSSTPKRRKCSLLARLANCRRVFDVLPLPGKPCLWPSLP